MSELKEHVEPVTGVSLVPLSLIRQVRTACIMLSRTRPEIAEAVTISYVLRQGGSPDELDLMRSVKLIAEEYGLVASLIDSRSSLVTLRISRDRRRSLSSGMRRSRGG
jgi:hypothetical protein